MTAAAEPAADDMVLALVEEALDIGVRTVETGRVRITTGIVTTPAAQTVTLARTRIRVERIDADRIEEATPQPRHADGVTIIPVFEEILVVRYRVTGEVHLIEETTSEDQLVRAELRRSVVDVERLPPARDKDADGGTVSPDWRP